MFAHVFSDVLAQTRTIYNGLKSGGAHILARLPDTSSAVDWVNKVSDCCTRMNPCFRYEVMNLRSLRTVTLEYTGTQQRLRGLI